MNRLSKTKPEKTRSELSDAEREWLRKVIAFYSYIVREMVLAALGKPVDVRPRHQAGKVTLASIAARQGRGERTHLNGSGRTGRTNGAETHA